MDTIFQCKCLCNAHHTNLLSLPGNLPYQLHSMFRCLQSFSGTTSPLQGTNKGFAQTNLQGSPAFQLWQKMQVFFLQSRQQWCGQHLIGRSTSSSCSKASMRSSLSLWRVSVPHIKSPALPASLQVSNEQLIGGISLDTCYAGILAITVKHCLEP